MFGFPGSSGVNRGRVILNPPVEGEGSQEILPTYVAHPAPPLTHDCGGFRCPSLRSLLRMTRRTPVLRFQFPSFSISILVAIYVNLVVE